MFNQNLELAKSQTFDVSKTSFRIHPKKPRKLAVVLNEIRAKNLKAEEIVKQKKDPLAMSSSMSAVNLNKAFSVKRIEKRFNKIDNALGLGEATLGEAMKDDADKERVVEKKFDRLCPTYFRLGICLEAPNCNCAHKMSDLSRTYMPDEWVNYFESNIQRLKSANPNRKFRQTFDEKSVNIDKIVNNKGQTLLLEACETCSVTMAKILLEKGADPNVVDWKGLNGLCYALKKDNYELAYALLKQSQFKVDLNKYVEKFKSPYLISAVKTASLKMIRLLLEEGADPNATDKNQANSLVYAIERNDEGILKLLLSKGTEVNNMDINKIDPLHHAIRLEHLPFIKLLLRGGASTTTSKKRGVQLIMMACDFGDPDLFDLLIEKGISWNTIDENGRNVVMRSYLAKNISLTQRLLIHYNLKSYVNFKDKHGNSLLMLAIKQEDLNFIEYLLQTCENLQIDQRNDEGKTPLLLACELNLGSIARALASRMNSTQINMADSQKNTALIWAVKHHNLIIISALLDNKDIDTTFKDALDKSPYDYAHTDEIRHLIYNHQLANKGKEAEIRVARDMAKRVNKKNKQSHL